MTVQTPPLGMLKGPDGRPKVYESVEERCAACQIKGGQEIPCVPAGELALYRQKLGQECPRVELDPENVDAVQLVGFCIHDDLKQLSPALHTAYVTHDYEQVAFLLRVAGAIRDPLVSEELHPKPKAVQE